MCKKYFPAGKKIDIIVKEKEGGRGGGGDS